MNYREVLPSVALKDFIKYFWFYKHKEDDFDFTVLPDACFDLVADYESEKLQNIYLTGVWDRPQKITVTRGTTLLAVRFRIHASEYIFHREIKTLLNTMTAISPGFIDLEELSVPDFDGFENLLSDFIISRIEEFKNPDTRKLNLFDLIYNNKIFSVSELSERIHWSTRQINRYFNSQYGFPLKKFLNMVRCQESYEGIANGNLYPSHFHVDQAHFIKEIRAFTGSTPRQLYKNIDGRFIQLSPLKKD